MALLGLFLNYYYKNQQNKEFSKHYLVFNFTVYYDHLLKYYYFLITNFIAVIVVNVVKLYDNL